MLLICHLANAQLPMPDSVCIGATKKYMVNDATVPSTYVWKINGITQSSITNDIITTWNTTGVYTITVQEKNASGCIGDLQQGVVYVFPIPVANAGNDTTICFNTTAILNGSGGSIYHWSPSLYLSNPNIANPIVSLPTAGIYSYVLNVENGVGCKSLISDTVKITILPKLQIFAGNDTTISINQQLQLNAIEIVPSSFVNYIWSPGFGLNSSVIKNPILSLNATGMYTYTVVGSNAIGCNATDAIIVKIFKGPEIYVPTAFTPNGDGTNDIFIPTYVGIKELKFFSVYNRFGQIVYTTKNQNQGWNGLFKGTLQNNEAFVWQVEGIDFDGKTIFRKGTVILAK